MRVMTLFAITAAFGAAAIGLAGCTNDNTRANDYDGGSAHSAPSHTTVVTPGPSTPGPAGAPGPAGRSRCGRCPRRSRCAGRFCPRILGQLGLVRRVQAVTFPVKTKEGRGICPDLSLRSISLWSVSLSLRPHQGRLCASQMVACLFENRITPLLCTLEQRNGLCIMSFIA